MPHIDFSSAADDPLAFLTAPRRTISVQFYDGSHGAGTAALLSIEGLDPRTATVRALLQQFYEHEDLPHLMTTCTAVGGTCTASASSASASVGHPQTFLSAGLRFYRWQDALTSPYPLSSAIEGHSEEEEGTAMESRRIRCDTAEALGATLEAVGLSSDPARVLVVGPTTAAEATAANTAALFRAEANAAEGPAALTAHVADLRRSNALLVAAASEAATRSEALAAEVAALKGQNEMLLSQLNSLVGALAAVGIVAPPPSRVEATAEGALALAGGSASGPSPSPPRAVASTAVAMGALRTAAQQHEGGADEGSAWIDASRLAVVSPPESGARVFRVGGGSAVSASTSLSPPHRRDDGSPLFFSGGRGASSTAPPPPLPVELSVTLPWRQRGGRAAPFYFPNLAVPAGRCCLVVFKMTTEYGGGDAALAGWGAPPHKVRLGFAVARSDAQPAVADAPAIVGGERGRGNGWLNGVAPKTPLSDGAGGGGVGLNNAAPDCAAVGPLRSPNAEAAAEAAGGRANSGGGAANVLTYRAASSMRVRTPHAATATSGANDSSAFFASSSSTDKGGACDSLGAGLPIVWVPSEAAALSIGRDVGDGFAISHTFTAGRAAAVAAPEAPPSASVAATRSYALLLTVSEEGVGGTDSGSGGSQMLRGGRRRTATLRCFRSESGSDEGMRDMFPHMATGASSSSSATSVLPSPPRRPPAASICVLSASGPNDRFVLVGDLFHSGDTLLIERILVCAPDDLPPAFANLASEGLGLGARRAESPPVPPTPSQRAASVGVDSSPFLYAAPAAPRHRHTPNN